MGKKKQKIYINLAGDSAVTGKKRKLAKAKSRKANAAGKSKARGSARSTR
jgi:hypothetical protein|tara:strand:+ start:211 stop:360 length:150 start_codon:yes stop_codon:yes gene_type:complete